MTRSGQAPGGRPKPVAAQDCGDARLGDGDIELSQFTHDAQVAPSRVLPGQAADELDRLVRQRRPARAPVGVCPVPADEAAVPGEHRLGRDQERAPPFTGDEASEQGDERPIGPGEAGPPDLAAEHCQLVAQDEDLGILGDVAQMVRTDELKDPPEETVQERQGHGRAYWPDASELVRHKMLVIGLFRPVAPPAPRPQGRLRHRGASRCRCRPARCRRQWGGGRLGAAG